MAEEIQVFEEGMFIPWAVIKQAAENQEAQERGFEPHQPLTSVAKGVEDMIIVEEVRRLVEKFWAALVVVKNECSAENIKQLHVAIERLAEAPEGAELLAKLRRKKVLDTGEKKVYMPK